MRRLIAAALLLAPFAAYAQPAPIDMVLMPRALVEDAANWVKAPDPRSAVLIWMSLVACINDNPHNGPNVRVGADQCPAVTQAIAARDKELADLKAAAKPATSAPTPSQQPDQATNANPSH